LDAFCAECATQEFPMIFQLTNRAGAAADEAAAYTASVLDALGARNPVEVLRETPAMLTQAVEDFPPELFGTPEAAGKWSVRDVVQHLADAELVGGVRFRMVLAHDRPQIPAFDQDLFANRLRYDESNIVDALRDFTALRSMNLRLLERTSLEDRARVGLHSERGEESVDLMLKLYAGHDVVHLRQISRIKNAVASG
jgi:hypothetical protein